MDRIRTVIQTEFRQFDLEIAKALHSDNQLLNDALDYVRTQRGKQLRPILVLWSSSVCRGVTHKTTQAAVALGRRHTAS